MTGSALHPMTWFAAVAIVAVGGSLLAVCVLWVRHRAPKNSAYSVSYAALPALVVGQMVFVTTSQIVLGIVTFLIVWGVTDRNTLPSPTTSSASQH